nr:hypothetical protein [Burkholderia cepacia]
MTLARVRDLRDETLERDCPLHVERCVFGRIVIVAVDEARIGQHASERETDRRLAAVDRAVQVDDGQGGHGSTKKSNDSQLAMTGAAVQRRWCATRRDAIAEGEAERRGRRRERQAACVKKRINPRSLPGRAASSDAARRRATRLTCRRP